MNVEASRLSAEDCKDRLHVVMGDCSTEVNSALKRDPSHVNELRSYFSVLLLAALAMGQPVKVTCQNAPDVNRIVTQQVVNNQKRAAVLRHYQSCRRNMLDYTGFPSNQTAELVVEMKYYTPAGKQFPRGTRNWFSVAAEQGL